jgi:hypothetical protein
MFLFPQKTFDGASDGLLLWFQTLLPTLLPFIILTNLLLQTECMNYLIHNPNFFVVIVGFLCGYPMGAKLIHDMRAQNKLTKKEGDYLLSFCNNASPMFIISYVVLQKLQNESLLFGALLVLYLSPFLCSLIFRRVYKVRCKQTPSCCKCTTPIRLNFKMVDISIMNGFETITRIGGYVILCSILCAWIKDTAFEWFICFLEISNGIHFISEKQLPLYITFPFVMGITSFGGICSILQTKSMFQKEHVSITPYIIEKLITAMVTSLFAILYMQFIHR